MIFVDTSFWIALTYSRDARHDRATALLERHGDDSLMTTNLVRGETWTFLRDRMGHRPAVALLDRIAASPRIELVHITEDLEAEALGWLRRHDERVYSFVDATSFAFMRARKIAYALAFDDDFAAAGFVELRT